MRRPHRFGRWPSLGRALLGRMVRAGYHALPLDDAAKGRLKSFVYRTFGLLFRGTASYRFWEQSRAALGVGRTESGSAVAVAARPSGAVAGIDSVFLVERAVDANYEDDSRSRRRPGPKALTPATLLRQAAKRRHSAAEAKAYCDKRARALLRDFLARGETLPIPASAAPKVSIVLVLHGRAELTYLCLASIVQTVDLPVETIVVDNGSKDETGKLLDRLEGAKIIRNDENRGFLKAVNQALGEAAGDHVLLLNNDALMFPGALAAALRTLESRDDIGAVGGRIVLLDGRLQEAGSIVWNDGTCLGYGRGAPPDDPAFLFRRDVDYCSGAFLLVRRDLFVESGGFDEAFAPAYYEETDLCMRLREWGYRVVYEPDAVVLHYEFASAPSPGRALEQQKINRETFAAKHRDALKRHCAPDPLNALVARSSERRKQRLLLLDDRVPHRGLGAGFPRAGDMVRGLVAGGCFVTLYPMMVPNEDAAVLYAELPREVEVVCGRGRTELAGFLAERAGYYDTILVSRPNNMETFNAVYESERDLFQGVRIIYDAEAIFARRDAAKRKLDGVELPEETLADLVQAEVDLGRWADRIVTVSQSEAAEFTERGLPEVHVLGHQVTPQPSPAAFEQRRGILFVGALQGDDTPNADSVLWFAEAVWPSLSKELPEDAEFVVAGTNKSHAVWSLDSGRISVRGFVDDLGALYDSCRLFVAPTRYAAGIPYKAHEAAAHGLPIVTTTLIADQLGWRNGEDLLVADTPEDFARQCLRLYESKDVWQHLRDGALQRVATECSEESFRASLAEIVREAETVMAVPASR
ncbi:MAG: glycosyltransferase [Rhodospirillales bacterium]|nr:glycosyltransferase [Rhodospirillales bacterium]